MLADAQARAVFATALLAALAIGSAATPAVAHQPSICDQYPDLPQCERIPTGDGGPQRQGEDRPPSTQRSSTATATATADAGPAPVAPARRVAAGDGRVSGELPLTGLPLAGLVAALIALLGGGIGLRRLLGDRP